MNLPDWAWWLLLAWILCVCGYCEFLRWQFRREEERSRDRLRKLFPDPTNPPRPGAAQPKEESEHSNS